MSVTYKCDVCGEVMEPDELNRIVDTVGRVKFEVVHALDGTWNGGHVCHACIYAAIREADGR